MENKNYRYLIAALFVVVLSLGVGYAIFSETINITGTAETTGTFDVEFSAAEVTTEIDASGSTAIISADKNLLTLDVPDLQRPGSTVVYEITIKNVGTIGAELININLTGDDDPDIVVTYPTFPVGTVLTPSGLAGDSYTFDITVEWANDSDSPGHDLVFDVSLDYQQDY